MGVVYPGVAEGARPPWRHEESPPTVRAGDRAHARSRRRLALEQRRHRPRRPMRRANRPERGPWSRGHEHRAATRAGREPPPRGRRSRISVDARERVERRTSPVQAHTDGAHAPDGSLDGTRVVARHDPRGRCGRSAECRVEPKGAYSPQPFSRRQSCVSSVRAERDYSVATTSVTDVRPDAQ